jgi:hypothetical protein
MRFIKEFKALLKSAWGKMTSFALLSIVFMISYIFFEYKQYISAYQMDQLEEVKSIQHKTKSLLKKVQELANLTSDRIVATEGEPKQIQSILVSAPRLYDPVEIPKIQKLSYYKLSGIPNFITRYERLPLDTQTFLIPQNISNKTSVGFYQDHFISKTPVFKKTNTLEGILEIQIALTELKAFLGTLNFVTLDSLFSSTIEKAPLLQKEPFAIYAKNPKDFWTFFSLNKARYGVFALYFSLCVFCCMLAMANHRRDLQMIYNERIENQNVKIETLNSAILELRKIEEETRNNFLNSEEKRKNHNITYNSYKKVQHDLKSWQQEQSLHICKCLNILTQHHKNPNTELSLKYQLKLLRSCLNSANLIAKGLISKTKSEPIEVITLLEETKSLFAEKIYMSKLNVEIVCSNDLNFLGDRVFTQFILVNFLGRAIHRVPKNGTVTLTSTPKDDGILFELRDKGFVLVNSTEKLIKKSFDFLIGENDFQKICIQNGLKYKYLRDEEDFNHTTIFMPQSSEREFKDNIVDLFRKEIELV